MSGMVSLGFVGYGSEEINSFRYELSELVEMDLTG